MLDSLLDLKIEYYFLKSLEALCNERTLLTHIHKTRKYTKPASTQMSTTNCHNTRLLALVNKHIEPVRKGLNGMTFCSTDYCEEHYREIMSDKYSMRHRASSLYILLGCFIVPQPPKAVVQEAKDLLIEVAFASFRQFGTSSLYNALITFSSLYDFEQHSSPEIVAGIGAARDRIFASHVNRILSDSSRHVSTVGYNAVLLMIYMCEKVEKWAICIGSGEWTYDFDHFDRIFCAAVGHTSIGPFAKWNETPLHPELVALVQPFCIDLLITKCKDIDRDLGKLQAAEINLESYRGYAGYRASEIDALAEKIQTLIRETINCKIGEVYQKYSALKKTTDKVQYVSVPWKKYDGFYIWNRIEYGTLRHSTEIFMAMLGEGNGNDWIHALPRIWTLSYDSIAREVVLHTGRTVKHRFTPDPIVQTGLDLYMSQLGFGLGVMTRQVAACQDEIHRIAAKGLQILQKTTQWRDFIEHVKSLDGITSAPN